MLTQSILKVQADYTFESNSIKLTLPGRARLLSISSLSNGSVNFYQNGHTLLIDNVISNYGGRIILIYTLPIINQEFYSDDWLVLPDEKGSVTAGLSLPEGFRGLIFPYTDRNGDGFIFDSDEKPLLICGRYSETSDTVGALSYDVYCHGKNISTIKDIDNIFEAYKNLIFPLDQKNIIIINLQALPGMVRFEKDSLFLITGGSTPEEIKYAFLRLWLKELLKFEGGELFAYTDLCKRLVDNKGQIRTDAAYLVPVPGRSYYENVISNGFTTTGEIDCDVSSMLKNFSMLHFAFFTAGIEKYTNYIKTYVTGKKDSNAGPSLSEICIYAGADSSVCEIAKYFLPVCSHTPDISIKRNGAVRNMDEIPDISALVNGLKLKLSWNGKRTYEISAAKGVIILDPDRIVPQLNFENDISVLDPHDAAEREAARDAAVKHKHFSGETARDVMYLDKFEYTPSTPFKITPGSSIYVALVRFYAPVKGKLVEGIKEVIINAKNGKAYVVEDRIRL